MNPKKPNIVNEDNNFEENVIEVNTVNEKKVFNIKHSIGKYFPVYGIWFAVVIFVSPL